MLARDLFLVNRQQPSVWGWRNEFISAPRLDDLGCAYISLAAFLTAGNDDAVSVFCCFDNEEVGSNTKQGAMSTFLRDCLERVNAGLGFTLGQLRCALAKSMLVSCDNAHAVHPNHPELYDQGNRVMLNRGLAVKEAANQKYCTDAFSRAVFCAICQNAGVPLQRFANRSDMPGGSTLGNLSNMQVSMHAVDVGLPQLAMHSSYERPASPISPWEPPRWRRSITPTCASKTPISRSCDHRGVGYAAGSAGCKNADCKVTIALMDIMLQYGVLHAGKTSSRAMMRFAKR